MAIIFPYWHVESAASKWFILDKSFQRLWFETIFPSVHFQAKDRYSTTILHVSLLPGHILITVECISLLHINRTTCTQVNVCSTNWRQYTAVNSHQYKQLNQIKIRWFFPRSYKIMKRLRLEAYHKKNWILVSSGWCLFQHHQAALYYCNENIAITPNNFFIKLNLCINHNLYIISFQS